MGPVAAHEAAKRPQRQPLGRERTATKGMGRRERAFHLDAAAQKRVGFGGMGRVLPLLAGLLALAGCDRRVGQCNELVERLNPHTEAMARAVEGLARVEKDPGTLDALDQAIDRADQELSVVRLEDEHLAGFGVRYRRQLMDARKAADAMRRAAADEDVAGLNAAAKQADAFLEAQAAILEELNHYCAGG
jgi:hypothetical protein